MPIFAYTVDNTHFYSELLEKNPDNCFKYKGGWIWETVAEARAFLESPEFIAVDWGDGLTRASESFSVYRVELQSWADVSPIPGKDGVYYLLVDSRLSSLW